VAALLLSLVVHWAGEPWLFSNPAHVRWEEEREQIAQRTEQANKWRREQAPILAQREFEEAIGGLRPPNLLRNRKLQGIATAIRSVEGSVVHARSKALYFLAFEERSMADRMTCVEDGCSFHGEFAVLEEPERLQRVLSGDARAIIKLRTMPHRLQHVPHLSTEPPTRLPPPTWWLFTKAGIFSFLFALAFCLTGWWIRAVKTPRERRFLGNDKYKWEKVGEPTWPPPLKTYPDSILGAALFLVMTPGLGVIHFLQFLIMDIRTVPRNVVERLRKTVERLRKKRKPFRDEYERIRSLLQELRERAVGHDNKQLTEQIDQTLERVRVAETQEQLKAIAGPLEDIQLELSSKAEAEAVVARRTAP
jgi:hypothetical protein